MPVKTEELSLCDAAAARRPVRSCVPAPRFRGLVLRFGVRGSGFVWDLGFVV